MSTFLFTNTTETVCSYLFQFMTEMTCNCSSGFWLIFTCAYIVSRETLPSYLSSCSLYQLPHFIRVPFALGKYTNKNKMTHSVNNTVLLLFFFFFFLTSVVWIVCLVHYTIYICVLTYNIEMENSLFLWNAAQYTIPPPLPSSTS